jgi:hypothetical protein
MGAEVCFQRGLMLIEYTGLPSKVEALQSFDALLLIQMQDCHDRLTGHAAAARTVLVRHCLTFEVHHFHALLHLGRSMPITFILQGSNRRVRKSDLNQHILICRNGFTTNTHIPNQW